MSGRRLSAALCAVCVAVAWHGGREALSAPNAPTSDEERCNAATELDAEARRQQEATARGALEKSAAELEALTDELGRADSGAGGDPEALRKLVRRVAEADKEKDSSKKKLTNAEAWVRWYDQCTPRAAAVRDARREDAWGLGAAGGYGRATDDRERATLSLLFSHQPRPFFRLEYRGLVAKEHSQDAVGAGVGAALTYGRVWGAHLGMDVTLVAQELYLAPKLGLSLRPLWSLSEAPNGSHGRAAWADARLLVQPAFTTQKEGAAILFGFEVSTGLLLPR